MAFRWASLVALVCLAVVVSAAEEVVERTYKWSEVSAAVGGAVGGMVLLIGIIFAIYDFTCRNYFAGKAGDYCRHDKEVAAGNSTKL